MKQLSIQNAIDRLVLSFILSRLIYQKAIKICYRSVLLCLLYLLVYLLLLLLSAEDLVLLFLLCYHLHHQSIDQSSPAYLQAKLFLADRGDTFLDVDELASLLQETLQFSSEHHVLHVDLSSEEQLEILLDFYGYIAKEHKKKRMISFLAFRNWFEFSLQRIIQLIDTKTQNESKTRPVKRNRKQEKEEEEDAVVIFIDKLYKTAYLDSVQEAKNGKEEDSEGCLLSIECS